MGKKTKKKDIIKLEREAVIPIVKQKLIATLAHLIESKSEHTEFLKLCQRVECIIRAWYHLQFDDLMELFGLFEPVHGAHKLEQRNLCPEEIDILEQKFLTYLFQMMDKSNFKITTDEEIDIALSAQYRLNLPIVVNESKLDKRLFTRYFAKNPHDDNLPYFADKVLASNIAFAWFWMLKFLIRFLFGKKVKSYQKDSPEPIQLKIEAEQDDLYVERIRIEKLNLRRRPGKHETERNIYVKHFKNIPMADLEIVLPEKKNPGLTPMDWVKFLVSATIGLVTVISSLSMPKTDIRVIFGILSAVVGYCVKTYFSFQKNLVDYQNLITRCVYDKQLDSGRGTLLHLCDEVIQQEVKEVIVSFFVLMEQGKAVGKEDLDRLCEQLIEEKFGDSCNFDVDDAVRKLEKLGIISQDGCTGTYACLNLKRANEIIGTTTEEVVLNLKAQG
ncbi:hypothetical protein REPUB_Repub09cG0001300 [Reevesia pubescens]